MKVALDRTAHIRRGHGWRTYRAGKAYELNEDIELILAKKKAAIINAPEQHEPILEEKAPEPVPEAKPKRVLKRRK